MDPLALTRLVLVRHGEVEDEWRQRIYGDLDVPLSASGQERSQRVAEALAGSAFDAIASSGLERADFLASLVERCSSGGTRVARVIDRDLREIGRGEWAGMDAAGVEAHTRGGWQSFRDRGGALVPPGGETFEALEQRVAGALGRLAGARPGGRVLVVAHRWVLTVALVRALGLANARGSCLEFPPCSVTVLDWPAIPGGCEHLAPRVVALGPDREHLRALLSRSASR